MTSPDLDTMHRAVLLDPADDLARLALADACEEAGELGRAEFVRLDVKIAAGGFCHYSRRDTCFARRYDIADVVGHGCLACHDVAVKMRRLTPWRDASHAPDVLALCDGCEVRRGLVESVALPLAAFMRHAKELFGRHPITAVRLTDRDFSYAYWVSSGRAVCSGPGYESHGFYIPYQIFRRLKGATTISPGFRGYATTELAHAALSAACVAHGRREAGLPPLPVHPRYEHAGEMDR